jgi:thiol-disulfide isomerase/thioredoxin
LFIIFLVLTGCEQQQNYSSPVGDMHDTSYAGQRNKVSRPNANDKMVMLQDWSGKFIWVDYAAPWCSPCGPQTQAVKSVASSVGSNVIFITVMTSDMGGYGDPATLTTAISWAEQFQLDKHHVLAANLTSMTVPKHILFSPDGHMLFEKTSSMSASDISTTLTQYMMDWNEWKHTLTKAEWMQ